MAEGQQRDGNRIGLDLLAIAPFVLACASVLVAASAVATLRPAVRFDAAVVVSWAGVLVGVVYLACAAKRGTVRGRARAVKGLTLSVAFGLLGLVGHSLAWKFQGLVHWESCVANVKATSRALQMYAADYDGVLPPAERWCEATSPYRSREADLVCPAGLNLKCGYAYNSHVAGADADLVAAADNGNVVCLCESDRGWEAAGGPELLPDRPRHDGLDTYGFVDGHVKRLGRGSHPARRGEARVWLKRPKDAGVIWTPSVAPGRADGKAAEQPR